MATGIVYCITSPSNKQYIGQTKRSLEKRLLEHSKQTGCRLIYNAIKKYGMLNLKVEVLQECNIDELNFYEEKFISDLNTMHPHGYNIRSGGVLKSIHCEESRQKMRESKLGSLNHNFGKPRDEITKEKYRIPKKQKNIISSGNN